MMLSGTAMSPIALAINPRTANKVYRHLLTRRGYYASNDGVNGCDGLPKPGDPFRCTKPVMMEHAEVRRG